MLHKLIPVFRLSTGKLFTWSDSTSPKQMQLPEKISRVSCGPSHTAILGESGNLYTVGNGAYGQLGHHDTKDLEQPKVVDYFQKKAINIKDVICGERHTIVLTEEGNVYTFGWGGRNLNFFMKIFMNPVGPLGHGNNQNCLIPTQVKGLEKAGKIQRISAGRFFNMAFNSDGDGYHWGKGEYGVFGDGNNKNYTSPVEHEYFQYLKTQQLLKVNKVKSCESFSVALMNDGKLYGWGSNDSGQMGIKSEIGIEIYETVNFVSEVIREGYQDQKVVNFDISENTLLFQVENGQLWWSGMKIAYKPEKVSLALKPKLFSAGCRSFAVVTHENKIYSKNSFLKMGNEDIKTGIQSGDGGQIFGGQIIGIGGQYQNRYAIIN